MFSNVSATYFLLRALFPTGGGLLVRFTVGKFIFHILLIFTLMYIAYRILLWLVNLCTICHGQHIFVPPPSRATSAPKISFLAPRTNIVTHGRTHHLCPDYLMVYVHHLITGRAIYSSHCNRKCELNLV